MQLEGFLYFLQAIKERLNSTLNTLAALEEAVKEKKILSDNN